PSPRARSFSAAPAFCRPSPAAAGVNTRVSDAAATMAALRQVDLTADAGESFGRWQVVDEKQLFEFLSSVNLAGGFHAGDPLGLRESIRLAAEHGVAIGAHPGFPDKVGFGRRDMAV